MVTMLRDREESILETEIQDCWRAEKRRQTKLSRKELVEGWRRVKEEGLVSSETPERRSKEPRPVKEKVWKWHQPPRCQLWDGELQSW